MFLGVLSGMSKYTAYSTGNAMNEIFGKMPSSLKALLGFGTLDVTKMPGFFAFLFLYLELAAGIHAILLGSGIIAKEERDKTTEFLLVKPVSRNTVVTSKFFSALVNIIIFNIVTLFSSIVMVAAYNKGKDISGEILVFMVSMFIVQLIFLSAGTAISACIRNPKASGALSAGIWICTYFIFIITGLNDKLKVLNLLSPIKYFDPARIAEGNGLDPVIVILSLVLIAALSLSTYVFYRKRDMSI